MTSDFALSLSHDTVRLLRRTPDGWETLGDADPSAEDASEQLALLRHSALPDKADTLECTVVLPDDLIRYLEAPAGGEDDDTRTLAEQALTGATPYAVDELVWDAIVADDRLCIAAVARETIEEAREFARSHHFEPTGFSAAAEHQSFPGAPDFGNGLPGSLSSSPGNVVAEVEAPETESASAPSDLITAAAQDDNIFGEVSTNAGPVAGYGLSEDPSPYEPPAPVRPSLAAATSLRPGRHVDLAAMQQSTKRDRGAVAAGFLAAVVVVSVISSALWATGIIGNGGIAAWLNRPSEIPPDAQFASPPQPAEPLAPVASASLPATPLTGTDAAILEALSVPVSPGPQPETPGHLAEERTAYAVTGIWPFAPVVPEPPALIDLNDLYSTSIDPVQISFDAIALPAVPATSPDQTLTAPASPAPAGTRFALDDQGLVRPSADGTVNPDGIRVFAGPPPARPPAERPVAAEPGEDPVLRALLAGIRPPPRPEDLLNRLNEQPCRD